MAGHIQLVENTPVQVLKKSNIYSLMQDMADALSTPGIIMLGGGSPALIDEAVKIFQSALMAVAKDKALLKRSVCQYSDSAGDVEFRQLLAEYLNRQQSWSIDKDNVLITGGSQSAFKLLFEHFAADNKKIVFPLLPDYIGYGILDDKDTLGIAGEIELIGDREFRYRISAEVKDNLSGAGALCLSRPCNPTGGMLPDSELTDLLDLANQSEVNLILDNAYGQPLPNIVYSERSLPWADNAIYCLSLSKMGLPGVRTGIVISDSKLISTLAELNAKYALAPGGIGPTMVSIMLQNGDLDKLLKNIIQPWYAARKEKIVGFLHKYFSRLGVRYHVVDGGFFNWIYYEDLPVNGHELYKIFKANKLIVVPGYAFAPGLKKDWPHLEKCFRISTGQPLEVVEKGIAKIAKVLQNI